MGIMKFKCDSVAFLDQAVIDGVCFSELTFSIFIILTMLAISMAADKNLFDMCWGFFDVSTVFIYVI